MKRLKCPLGPLVNPPGLNQTGSPRVRPSRSSLSLSHTRPNPNPSPPTTLWRFLSPPRSPPRSRQLRSRLTSPPDSNASSRDALSFHPRRFVARHLSLEIASILDLELGSPPLILRPSVASGVMRPPLSMF
jgi:hypothetical protein